MMEWLTEIRAALDREFGSEPRIMALATRDASGGPHARCVVCRQIDDEGRIYIATDARMRKNTELRSERRAELLAWMPKLKIQFRLTGETKLVAYPEDEKLRKEIWRLMSNQARSRYFWPTPGVAVDPDDAFAEEVSADVSPPATFEVLILEPKLVECLSVESHPHRRRVWRADAKWSGVSVNP